MKSIFNQIATFLFILLAAPTLSKAQQVHHLDLETSLEIAKEQSFTMLILRQNLIRNEQQLKIETSGMRTHVDLNLTAPDYTETIREFEDTTGITLYSVRQSRIGGDLVINQPLPTAGNIYIRSGLWNTIDHNDSKRITKLNTRFGLNQPIEALYAYNSVKASLKSAKLDYELSKKQLKRAELDLNYSISNEFYDLLMAQEKMKIAELALTNQQEAYNIAQNKYSAELIREVEALQTEVDLAETQNSYDIAVINYQSHLNSFKEALNLSMKDSIILNSTMDYQKVLVDPEKAVTLALNNRLELEEKEIQIELNQLELKRRKSQGMINGDITAYYDLIGDDVSPSSSSLTSSISSSYNSLANRNGNFGVGLKINVPIIDWGQNKARVKAQEATIKQNQYRLQEEKLSIEREIINLVGRLQSTLKRLQLLEKNIKVAEKSFNISQMRFSDGDISSQDLALERDRLNNAYQTHLSSYFDYKLLLADLMRKTFYDFEKGRSAVYF